MPNYCIVCSNEFWPAKPFAKYCSDACKRSARQALVSIVVPCSKCGTPVTRSKYKARQRNVFCSSECRRVIPPTKCGVCGDIFRPTYSKQRYCSNKCRASSRSNDLSSSGTCNACGGALGANGGCRRCSYSAWIATNRNKVRIYQRRYALRHPERVKQSQRKYKSSSSGMAVSREYKRHYMKRDYVKSRENQARRSRALKIKLFTLQRVDRVCEECLCPLPVSARSDKRFCSHRCCQKKLYRESREAKLSALRRNVTISSIKQITINKMRGIK
jgi:hypothetical protein